MLDDLAALKAEKPIDESLCPLCGGPNRCGVAEGKDQCWCFEAQVAEEIFEQIPVQERLRR